MGTIRKFADGVVSFVSELTNSRAATAENGYYSQRLTPVQLNELYRSGLGNKIIRFKAGGALRNTLQFARTEDEQFYRDRLAERVKEAARWMLAYGRGVILIQHPGDDLTKPLGAVDPARLQLRAFDGGLAIGMLAETDLQHPRYMLPRVYSIRGVQVHHSRVVDFTYVKPAELELPYYHYGGLSEFELIYDQMIADGVVQRASPRVIEKASALFYKVTGFKDAMAANEHSDMVKYFGKLEQLRGIFSAGLIDKEDDLEVVAQNIANLADADQITLRRLAMVTGISFTALVGESPKGLNATGEQERVMDQNMLEALQSDYLLRPINELMYKTGQGVVSFKENQGETPNGRIDYETKAIANAEKLAALGEDYGRYLRDKGVTVQDDYAAMFGDEA
jgi:hypothetical protein